MTPTSGRSHPLAMHRPPKPEKSKAPEWQAHNPDDLPSNVRMALREAMRAENVPPQQFDDLLWLIAQESNGKVNARNKKSTARGLFQLLKNQYSLNPNGERSFGNATEECQGGIRYVMQRYHSATAARAFWFRHHWY